MRQVTFGWVLFLAMLCGIMADSCKRAGSQDAPRASEALLLARVCVSEAGWSCWARHDGYAIHEATLTRMVRRRIENVPRSLRWALTTYSPRATGVEQTRDERLRWVSQLNERGDTPRDWPPPPHVAWASYRGQWLSVLDRAREVVTWTLDDRDEWSVCDESPSDWAAPEHPPSAGLRLVNCGRTRNRFYR